MNVRTLTEKEIQQALTISDINERKSYIQSLVIDHFVKCGSLVFTGFTGIGKGYMCKSLVKRYRKKSDGYINIVVPRKDIQKTWENTLLGEINIRNFVLNSYTKNTPEDQRTCDICILDEGHWTTGVHSKFFSKAIPITRFKRVLVLSATLRKEQLAYLESLGIKHVFNIPLATGYRLGIVPTYYQFNIPIQFTEQEKQDYLAIQEEYARALIPFEQTDPDNATFLAGACLLKAGLTANGLGYTKTGKEWSRFVAETVNRTPGDIIGDAIKWQQATSHRKSLLYDAIGKINAIQEILSWLPSTRVLVFTPLTRIADTVSRLTPSGVAYYGTLTASQKKKALAQFELGEKHHLVSCGMLKEGVNIPNVSWGINGAVNAQQKDLVQMMGRLIRYEADNPTKVSVMINLYVDDFTIGDRLITSQEKQWLRKSQFKQPFITWLPSLEKLKEELTDLQLLYD